MDEKKMTRALTYDFSADEASFREALLSQCLAVLGQGEGPLPAVDEPFDIDDDSLDVIVAAGDPATLIEVLRDMPDKD